MNALRAVREASTASFRFGLAIGTAVGMAAGLMIGAIVMYFAC